MKINLQNKLTLFIVLMICVSESKAQITPQFSQYFQNYMLINPAATGLEDYWDLKTSFRSQWTGFENAPNTGFLTINGTLNSNKWLGNQGIKTSIGNNSSFRPGTTLKHGLGAFVMVDRFGPIAQNIGGISYASHFRLSPTFYFSLGTSVGLNNTSLNIAQLSIKDNINDATYNSYMNSNTNNTYFDWNMGTWIYSENFFFGYSAQHLVGNSITFGDQFGDNEILMHHFVTVGYKVKLSDDVDLIPSMLFKYMNPTPLSFDLSFKLRYQNKLWLAAAYRRDDAVAACVGFTLNRNLNISYSYDYQVSNLRYYSFGGHEVILGINLGASRRDINRFAW